MRPASRNPGARSQGGNEPVRPLRLALVLLAALLGAGSGSAAPPSDGWRAFEGTWSAAGERHLLPTDGGANASVIHLSGAVVLRSGEGLSRGFRGEVVGYDDGHGLAVGRCVFTDEHGDRIFSEIKGGAVGAGRRFSGVITGGTGRYADLSGDYAFTWEYVVESEDGQVQGRTTTLKGRARNGPPPRPEGSR